MTRPPDFVAPIEIDAGIVWPPVQQYALIDTALAHHEHIDAPTHRQQVASLWARFNAVAQRNPDAAFPAPRTAEDIATPGPKNRPLAHPYNLWHSSQWTVDQASALLFCSAERATAAGVATDRWVFPRVALHSSQAITLTARRDLHAWPAMGILGRPPPPTSASPSPTSRTPRSTPASRPPCGCNSGTSAWPPRAPPP